MKTMRIVVIVAALIVVFALCMIFMITKPAFFTSFPEERAMTYNATAGKSGGFGFRKIFLNGSIIVTDQSRHIYTEDLYARDIYPTNFIDYEPIYTMENNFSDMHISVFLGEDLIKTMEYNNKDIIKHTDAYGHGHEFVRKEFLGEESYENKSITIVLSGYRKFQRYETKYTVQIGDFLSDTNDIDMNYGPTRTFSGNKK